MKITLAAILLIAATLASAETLPAAEADLIESAGIPRFISLTISEANAIGHRFGYSKTTNSRQNLGLLNVF